MGAEPCPAPKNKSSKLLLTSTESRQSQKDVSKLRLKAGDRSDTT